MTTYSAAYCREMIRHYERQACNPSKPARWHELARLSVAEWQCRLIESTQDAPASLSSAGA